MLAVLAALAALAVQLVMTAQIVLTVFVVIVVQLVMTALTVSAEMVVLAAEIGTQKWAAEKRKLRTFHDLLSPAETSPWIVLDYLKKWEQRACAFLELQEGPASRRFDPASRK